MANTKIRDDLAGVVWVEVDGQPHKLAAGDTVPPGVTVGAHLLDSESDDAASKEPEVVVPDGAPSDEWKVPQLRKYAEIHSIDLGDAKRKDEILAKVTPAPAADDAAPADVDEDDDEDGQAPA